MQEEEKEYLRAYMGVEGTDIAWAFIKECMKSVSGTCMIMMQDVMSLDNKHRMNSPGKAAGNWAWRVGTSDVWSTLDKEAVRLRALAVDYDRFGESEEVKKAAKAEKKAKKAAKNVKTSVAASVTKAAAAKQTPAKDIKSLQ